MLIDLNGAQQPAIGTQAHWSKLIAVMGNPVIFDPLRAEVVRVVNDAIAANPAHPQISSREAGADALQAIGSTWHALFPRHFPNFDSGDERGVFGMALWHYLTGRQDTWCFSGIADPYGFGQDATQYWRV